MQHTAGTSTWWQPMSTTRRTVFKPPAQPQVIDRQRACASLPQTCGDQDRLGEGAKKAFGPAGYR
jgi:hypothetical protein